MTKYHAMLLLSVLFTAVALVFFKMVSMDARGELLKILFDVRFYYATAVYAIAFLMWLISASRIEYTVLVYSNAAGLIASGMIGYFVFHESITIGKIVAYVLIASGVISLVGMNARA